MKRQTIIILIISAVVLAAIGIPIAVVLKKKREKELERLLADDDTSDNSNSENHSGKPTNTNNTNSGSNHIDNSLPKFNSEGELINSISFLKGKTVYPKPRPIGDGYANVRESAEVNTSSWWADPDNLLTKIDSPNPIGEVLSDDYVMYNGYNYRWFKVKLRVPVGSFFFKKEEGYVRADVVTI